MTPYDEQLHTLRAQTAELRRLRAKQRELETARRTLDERVRALAAARDAEQRDVDRLEGRSLAALFCALRGQKAERLDKERREACEAAVRYDAARRELDTVERDLARCAREAAALEGCEARCEALLADKRAYLIRTGAPHAARLLEIEEQLAAQQALDREIGEALAAGSAARQTADKILSCLDSAGSWGMVDLIGGGLLVDLAKHSELDDAQAQVEQLQAELRRFRTELADVSVSADIEASVQGFLGFADFFFDGLFADWLVLDHIGDAQRRAQETAQQIDAVRDRLSAMQADCRAAAQRLRDEQTALTEQA